MGKTTIKLLVDGGKASAGPPLGPGLAPLKVNIGQVVSAINEKTKEFAGVQVPVSVVVDTETKEFEIKIGSPPVSAMIKKEMKKQTLAKSPWRIFEKDGVKEEFTDSITFDQVLKITKAKMDNLKTDNIKSAIKQVLGTCVSAGVRVDGQNPKDIIKMVNEGKFDNRL